MQLSRPCVEFEIMARNKKSLLASLNTRNLTFFSSHRHIEGVRILIFAKVVTLLEDLSIVYDRLFFKKKCMELLA